MTSSICSETTVTTGTPLRDDNMFLHQKRKINEIQYLDIFEFLLNPLLTKITNELNSISHLIHSESSVKNAPSRKLSCKDDFLFPSFDFNMNKKPNDETMSISNYSFLECEKDDNFNTINESLHEIEDSLLDSLIYENILKETSSSFCSSIKDIDINEKLEEYNCNMKKEDIISQVYQVIERSVRIQKILKEENIDSSQLFRNKTKLYSMMDTEMKRIILGLSETYETHFLSRIFGISPKSIMRWSKNGIIRKKGAGRKHIDPQMEKKLYKWYNMNKRKGIILTAREIRKKAKELSTVKTFLASKGWLEKFKKNYGITVRKNN